jgi:hypothetical protein
MNNRPQQRNESLLIANFLLGPGFSPSKESGYRFGVTEAESTTPRQRRVADGALVVPRAPNTEGSKVTGGRAALGREAFKRPPLRAPLRGDPWAMAQEPCAPVTRQSGRSRGLIGHLAESDAPTCPLTLVWRHIRWG